MYGLNRKKVFSVMRDGQRTINNNERDRKTWVSVNEKYLCKSTSSEVCEEAIIQLILSNKMIFMHTTFNEANKHSYNRYTRQSCLQSC